MMTKIKQKKKKLNKKAKKKQKILAWTVIILKAINVLIVIGFLVYLYFWVKAR